jgi:hypothetical protein
METNNYLILYSGVKRRTQTQMCVIFGIHKSMKNTIINYKFWIETIFEVKLNIGRRKLSFFNPTSRKKKELKETKIL